MGSTSLCIIKSAVRGGDAHYRIHAIQARHWKALTESSGIPTMWKRMRDHVEYVAPALAKSPGVGFHHASFQVATPDEVGRAGRALIAKGNKGN
jgi:hypothetical protein